MSQYIEMPDIVEIYENEYNLDKQFKSSNKFVQFTDTFRLGHIYGIQRAASWYVDDYSKFENYCKDIRILEWMGNHDAAFKKTADLNIFMRKRYNDHHPSKLGNTNIEAIDAIVGHNKIVASGVVGIVQILGMQSTEFFLWVSMGSNSTPERIGQKNLIAEEIRVSVQRDGGMAARGNVWNHVGNMGYGVRSDTYYEFGVHNKAEGGRMLSRSVLAAGLEQSQNNTFLTPSHSTVFMVQ